MEVSRRSFLVAAGLAGAGLTNCGGDPSGESKQSSASLNKKGRVVILGFDGVEPTIIQRMIDAGELPNMAKLQAQGTFKPLQSTIPPQSPVAWTSFSTCVNPGQHNIFDFIRRNTKTMRPKVGTGAFTQLKLNEDGTLDSPAKATSYRRGTPFWKVADESGLRCKVFNVPFAFPSDDLKNGIQLSGLGVPDVRGTTSISFSLNERFTDADLNRGVSGGKRIRIKFDGSDNTAFELPGPRNNLIKFGKPGDYTPVRVQLTVDRAGGEGRIQYGQNEIQLKTGQWSEWLPVVFKMSDTVRVEGLTRFFPISIGKDVNLYASCMQFQPSNPLVPFSTPPEYAANLRDRYGLYKTVGWAFDTHAVRQGWLHEQAFLLDTAETMEWREKLTLDELDGDDFDMLISVWTATDRLGHMFWRARDEKHPLYTPELAQQYGTTLEESYMVMDRIVGNVMQRIKEDDLLMVLSDHGFESWRKGFDINRWLVDNKYLAVSNPAQAKAGFMGGLDWKNTTAYSVGLGSVYLNMQGRERDGIVAYSKADKLMEEIRGKLLEVKDPDGGVKPLSEVYTRKNFSGDAMREAPDLALGYTNAYQSAKSAAMGGVSDNLFSLNNDKWSGEHAASDRANLPGIFFANRPVEGNPDIMDLGVTALRYLGADVPEDYEGQALL